LKFLGIIPAKEHSTGVKNKNIRNLLGKPLIYYTIKEALKSKYINKLIVSTDSSKIASIAKSFKAEVPFLRPKNLAKTDTKMIDVLTHAILTTKALGYDFDCIVCLQPTNPFRKASHIDEAIEKIKTTNCDVIISITEVSEHPYWMVKLTNKDDVVYYNKQGLKTSPLRQYLPKLYRINGAILVAKIEVILKNNLYDAHTKAIIMDKLSSFDIDTELDFKLCEILAKEMLT
jgi:N-acylneuraminate cytidylyltransferase/CMP-N,N'-diacetyllegionaminic acid synthase